MGFKKLNDISYLRKAYLKNKLSGLRSEFERNSPKSVENHTEPINDIPIQRKDQNVLSRNGGKSSGKEQLYMCPSNEIHGTVLNSKQLSAIAKINDDEKRCSIVTEL